MRACVRASDLFLMYTSASDVCVRAPVRVCVCVCVLVYMHIHASMYTWARTRVLVCLRLLVGGTSGVRHLAARFDPILSVFILPVLLINSHTV